MGPETAGGLLRPPDSRVHLTRHAISLGVTACCAGLPHMLRKAFQSGMTAPRILRLSANMSRHALASASKLRAWSAASRYRDTQPFQCGGDSRV